MDPFKSIRFGLPLLECRTVPNSESSAYALYPWTRGVPLLGHNPTQTDIETNISCSNKYGNVIFFHFKKRS